MGKVIVMNWVTLDGVMQAPGSADEDRETGFPAVGGQLRTARRRWVRRWASG